MFLSLQIKTNIGWQEVVLPPDASLHIEDVNPLLDIDAGGAFSYPFTLPIEVNQHIFPTLTNHHGAKVYDLIYHKPFRLSGGGYPFLYGIIDIDNEVEIEEEDDGTHSITVNLASNNQELSALLDGVKAQDIPLKSRIPVGTEFRYLDWDLHVRWYGWGKETPSSSPIKKDWDYYSKSRMSIPAHIFSTNTYKGSQGNASIDGTGNDINSTNVTDPYPAMPYCNARVAIQAREKQSDGSYVTLREYEVFDADRANSGICFYVQYFLDCIFAYYGIAWDNSRLMTFDDFNRLAFFSTKCECDAQSTVVAYDAEQMKAMFPNLGLEIAVDRLLTGGIQKQEATFSSNAWVKYANSKNFPDEDAINIIKELQNAFGIRFIYDSEGQRCKAVFIKDVLNDLTSVKSGAIIHNAYHKDQNTRGVRMTYGGGEDDTSYNYDPKKEKPASPVIIRNGYAGIRKEKGAYDRKTYYDTVTGNWFRIKVDEDAKTEEEWYPSLFEVGQFQDAWVGDITDDKKDASDNEQIKEVTVGFSPVICNIVGKVEETSQQTTDGRKRTSALSQRSQPESSSECQYAVFLDLQLEDEQQMKLSEGFAEQEWLRDDGNHEVNFRITTTFGIKFWGRYGFASDYMEKRNEYAKSRWWHNDMSKPVIRYDEDPLSTYEAGFTLGIMRGPGNDAGVDIVQDNYDGNGNARWAFVPTGYAFTSDSIDHFGRIFNYNGTDEGGLDLDGRVSLKLQAEKVCNFQGEKVSGNQVKVTTKEQASYWLAYLFPDSNPDLLELRPQLKSTVSSKGWSTTGFPNVIYVYPAIRNGLMCNVMQDDGTVLTPSELDDYTANHPSRTGTSSRRDAKNILIKKNATQQDINDLIGLANIYYYPDTATPYTLNNVPATATKDYYPINSNNAKRGLLHKFNYEYFWFLINSRPIVLEMTMTLQEIRSLDKLRWHTFGQYTGLIERLEYDLDNETGLSHVTLTLLYL